MIDSLDDDGKLNEHGLHYNGKDRFEVRKAYCQRIRKKSFG